MCDTHGSLEHNQCHHDRIQTNKQTNKIYYRLGWYPHREIVSKPIVYSNVRLYHSI